jgi:ABC-type Mn2+/Zn2+ transport system permease subunit
MAIAPLSILATSDVLANTLRVAAASAALGVAAAVLSVFVVLRRWAYLGEGIAHAGFGGVGTGVLLAIAFPVLNDGTAIFLIGAGFAMATAVAVAWISRHRAVSGDTAVGIFVAAALAWGFIAFAIDFHLGRGGATGWENYLIGNINMFPAAAALLAIVLAAAILAVVGVLRRQIILYCFDPTLAEVTGVPVGLVHYLLILLIGLVIIAAMQVLGMLLVSALLVLPGAAGLTASRKLKSVMAVAIASNVVAVIGGIALNWHWPFIGPGPTIVGVLFVEFLIVYLLRPRTKEV